jgi:S-methylmethionine-dependent homocysteine/selenocysteine methylase
VRPYTLLDGAMGTELMRRGFDARLPLWSALALIEAPDQVYEIHRDYVEAGADVITTNTFRTNRRIVARAGLDDGMDAELGAKAVELAKRAAAEAGRKVLVAGSIAPVEDCYKPGLVPDDEALASEHARQARILADAGCDILLCETMNTLREALASAKAAIATGVSTWVSVVCSHEGSLLSGEDVGRVAREIAALTPSAMLVNCTPATSTHVALAKVADAATAAGIPFGAYANIGRPARESGWEIRGEVGVREYADCARRWLDMGASVIGGCCGTTPAHIAELRKMRDSA